MACSQLPRLPAFHNFFKVHMTCLFIYNSIFNSEYFCCHTHIFVFGLIHRWELERKSRWAEKMGTDKNWTWSWTCHRQHATHGQLHLAVQPCRLQHRQSRVCRQRPTKRMLAIPGTRVAPKHHLLLWCWQDAPGASCTLCCRRKIPGALNVEAPSCLMSSKIITPLPPPRMQGTEIGCSSSTISC